jgi:hypothetical protein
MNTHSKALAVYTLFFSLLLFGCETGQVPGSAIIPTSSIAPTPTITYTPTLTPTVTSTFTPTVTFTPESSATPDIQIAICTSENFLDYEIPEESLLDGTYREVLGEALTTPFDPAKIMDVPLWGNATAIIYYIKRPPFNPSQKETWPFQRYLTGYTEYQGNVYAVMPIKFWNPKGEDSIMIGLYKFESYESTDEKKKAIIKRWEDEMNITPLAYASRFRSDPLVSKSLEKYPDWKDRLVRFVNNNKYNAKNQDISAMDGMMFLTIIEPNGWYR